MTAFVTMLLGSNDGFSSWAFSFRFCWSYSGCCFCCNSFAELSIKVFPGEFNFCGFLNRSWSHWKGRGYIWKGSRSNR